MDVDESSSGSEEIRGDHEEEKSSKCGDQDMASGTGKHLEEVDAAVLRDIAAGLDCFIGDEELLVSKKALTCR